MLGKITETHEDSVKIELQTNIYELDNIIGKNVIFD